MGDPRKCRYVFSRSGGTFGHARPNDVFPGISCVLSAVSGAALTGVPRFRRVLTVFPCRLIPAAQVVQELRQGRFGEAVRELLPVRAGFQ